jgi:hypothetical protein
VIVTYVPAGAEPRQWTFRPLDISSREAELVEDYTGRTYTSWSEAFYAGSVKAQRIGLWLLLRRDDPTLPLELVDYQLTELRVAWDSDGETEELRRHITDTPFLDEGERAKMLAQFPDPEPVDDEVDEDADDPKDTAPAAGAGSGESPTS